MQISLIGSLVVFAIVLVAVPFFTDQDYKTAYTRDIFDTLKKSVIAFVVLLVLSSVFGDSDSNCYTEWDGRSNPTYCD